MAQNRKRRIDEEFKRELSKIMMTLKDPRMNTMVTISAVKVTNDLKFANVYYSVLGGEEEKKSCKEALNSASGYLRREISQSLNLRNTPMLIFKLDESLETGARINELLNKISEESDKNERQGS